jgi:hypothetical protein
LENYYPNLYWLSFDEFVKAVGDAPAKRQKCSDAQIARLRTKHSELLVPTRNVKAEIITLEQKLSDLVGSAYGLTHDEMRLMWRTAPPRMPLDRAEEQLAAAQ